VAAALPIVWNEEPELRMVWAGREEEPEIVRRSQSLWGEHAAKVVYLGALDRQQMPGLISKATASVLPSKVDNLPNTVVESVALGVPVIGSAGASIDELIEDGVNGLLVPIGDVPGLARAMIRMWQLPVGALSGYRSPILEEMRPSTAVDRFLEFARGGAARSGRSDA
jgi:glycosyltransferase involved in cell wall biosynthesis